MGVHWIGIHIEELISTLMLDIKDTLYAEEPLFYDLRPIWIRLGANSTMGGRNGQFTSRVVKRVVNDVIKEEYQCL